MKLEEILKRESQKRLTVEQAILKAKKGKDSYTSTRLGVLWNDLRVIHTPNKFHVGITRKEIGQLKLLSTKVGEVCDVGVLLSKVIKDWVEFGKFLKDQGLVSDFPDFPRVGWVLKYAESAIEFTQKESTTSGGFKTYIPN